MQTPGAQRKDCPWKNSERCREEINGREGIGIEGEDQQQEEIGMNGDATMALLPTTPIASSHVKMWMLEDDRLFDRSADVDTRI